MPLNITDNPVWVATARSVADGDAATAANFLLGMQDLANRTAFLNGMIGAGGSGITLIKTVANEAALTAVTSPVNGSYAIITGQGLYVYSSTSTAATAAFLIVNGNGGVGRWLWVSQGVANTSPGIAVISSGGKIPASVLTNHILSMQWVGNGSGFSTTSTSPVDITGLTVSLPGSAANDIVRYRLDIPTSMSAGTGSFRLALIDGAANFNLDIGFGTIGGSSPPLQSLGFAYTVANGGTIVVKGQLSSGSGANTATVWGNAYLTAELIRP